MRELEEERQKEEEKRRRREEEWEQKRKRGQKYGDAYWRYQPDDLKDIIDYDFLVKLQSGFWPWPSQPRPGFEEEIVNDMYEAINDRMLEFLD